MTCPGPSEPKAGAPAFTYVGRELIKTWLSSSALPWMFPIIDTFKTRLIDVGDLCAAGQPPTVAFDIDDLLAVIEPLSLASNPLGIQAVLAKLDLWVNAYAWSENCQCIGGGCNSPAAAGPYDVTLTGTHDGGRATSPTAPNQLKLTFTAVKGTFGGTAKPEISVRWKNSGGGFIAYTPSPVNQIVEYGTTGPFYYTPPSGAAQWDVYFALASGGSGAWPTISWASDYCGPTLGTSTLPPPSDPVRPTGAPDYPVVTCTTQQNICDQLESLTKRVEVTRDMVTLIQRQHVPFAFVNGASHSISGTGSFAVQGIAALRIALVMSSAYAGRIANPTQFYDLGEIAFGDADGYQRPERLTQANTIIDVPPWATSVSYYLPSGVSGTATERKREP